jgi:hypothetical protein
MTASTSSAFTPNSAAVAFGLPCPECIQDILGPDPLALENWLAEGNPQAQPVQPDHSASLPVAVPPGGVGAGVAIDRLSDRFLTQG